MDFKGVLITALFKDSVNSEDGHLPVTKSGKKKKNSTKFTKNLVPVLHLNPTDKKIFAFA